MKQTSKTIQAAVGLLTILLVSYSPSARAGWSVSVGKNGIGTVQVKVSNACGSTVIKTPYVQDPSATINQQSNFFIFTTNFFIITTNIFVFTTNRPLPACASPETYVQVRASSNYVTSIQSKTGNGDTNDSDEVLQFVIPRSACASGDVEVIPILITSTSVTFHYIAKLSDEGSAVLLRVVDSETGQQRYVVLLTGPSDNTANPCDGTFTVTGDPEKLNLLVDGNTSTLPFSIACPGDMVIGCGAAPPATYNPPAVATGDTGPFTVTYDRLPNQLAFGVTNTVTATARDTNGCTVKCQFKVYRQAMSFYGFDAPISGADATGGSCDAPLRIFKLGNVVPVKFAVTCGGVPVTSGVPPSIKIQNCSSNAVPYVGLFELFNNEWHFNIDSTVIGTAGKYTLTAMLPDGSQHSAVIQYKR